MRDFLKLSAIVLAAGLSRRAAPRHKLLLPAPDQSGRTVVRATVEAVVAAGFGEIIVVTGHAREQVEAALAGLPIRPVFAPDFAGGMGHSLAAGVRAAAADAAGFALVPADLPELTGPLIRTVVDDYLAGEGRQHVIPMAAGARGHPVIMGKWIRSQLAALRGDIGAREILASPAELARCRFLDVRDRAILRDVDAGGRGFADDRG